MLSNPIIVVITYTKVTKVIDLPSEDYSISLLDVDLLYLKL